MNKFKVGDRVVVTQKFSDFLPVGEHGVITTVYDNPRDPGWLAMRGDTVTPNDFCEDGSYGHYDYMLEYEAPGIALEDVEDGDIARINGKEYVCDMEECYIGDAWVGIEALDVLGAKFYRKQELDPEPATDKTPWGATWLDDSGIDRFDIVDTSANDMTEEFELIKGLAW